MKLFNFVLLLSLVCVSFHKVEVSSFRLPASENTEETELSQEQQICENENKIASLKKELDELEDKREELEELLDKALAKNDELDGGTSSDRKKKKVKKGSYEDLSNYMTAAYMYQMYTMAPTINYLNNPIHNSSSSQLVSYLSAVQMNQRIFENKWAGTWTPTFTPNGDLVDYQYGPAGVYTNQLIEQTYRPEHTLESYYRSHTPRGSFAF
ncbi:MAG: nucleotide exchange factor GrpE [Oligoflexia bacterium]|nr:nucleotide exchange factor GrpE [Oligoflexia bacterium]